MRQYPASPAQQRLWIVQQEEPDSPAYNLSMTFNVDPAVTLPEVEAAFAAVVARHDSLRTSFTGDGDPRQAVHPEVPVRLDDWDLRGLPVAARSAERESRLADQRRTPIRLDAAPLWRAALLREDDATAVLCLVIHHSVCDAWSLGVIQEELLACLAGDAAELPDPVPYRVHAQRQLEWLAGPEGKESIAYWADHLAGAPVETTLPSDRARPETPTGRGEVRTFTFPARLHEQARALARQHRASAHHVLFAGLAALVHRCTGAEDLVLGSSVSGRGVDGTDRAVGMFVNALAVRLRPTAATPFSVLLGQARDAVLDGLEHQQVPFDRVVAEVAPPRESGRNPLYQIGFNQVPVSGVQASTGTAKFDLLFEVGDDLSGRVEYSAELYDEGTVEAFVAVWFAVLEDAVAHPDRALGVLRTTTGSSISQAVAVADPAPSVLERVRRWAAQTPDAVAVEDPAGNQLSYRTLWQRAGALAADLKARGAGPDDRVLLLTTPTVETAVAVLGVLRAGAAYVCLDPAAPMARLSTVAEDSGAFLAVCSAEHRRLVEALDVAVLDVPAEAGRDAGDAVPAGSALAYVVYTSGSTGRPKGVGVTHANLAAYLHGLEELLDQRPGEAYLLAQPLTFDFGLTMFFGALASGSRLVFADLERVLEAGYLEDVVARCAIDHLKLTPSHLGSLIAEEPERLSRLAPRRTLVLGGEASSYDDVRAWRAALPGRAVVNHYGPTETTVGVVALAGDSSPASGGRTTPIGYPLAGVTAEVLDDALNPVAPGVIGQLVIGGPQVARGYLGDSEATEAAFVPDPAAPDARRYLTGDRARRLPGSGALEFLGRTDDQVKVRGYRVETNEVRSALVAAPEVSDAAVVVGDDGALHGFVVGGSPDSAPDSNRLRSLLLRSLPDYMVPTTLHVIAALPLAGHGKVDRRALLDGLNAETASAPVTPGATGAGVIDVVTAAFAQILERDRIAPDDDFFAAGGHSLLAIRLVALLRKSLEVALPVRAAFEHSTPQALSRRISELRGAGAIEPLRPRADDGPARASFGQERLWLMERTEGGDGSYNTHFRLTLTGPLAVSALRGALDEVAARHDALRTGLELTDDGIVQVVAGRVTVPVERVDLREIDADARDEHLARLLEQHAQARFDLTAPPLLRVLLARTDDSVHEALFSAHHAVFDGSSVDRFVDDLLTAYAALRRGQPATLAPLPVQYADFADWQRTVVGDAGGPLQAYWREHLDGFAGQLSMPTDRVPAARRDSAGAHALFDLDSDLTERLRELAREETATLTMVLLAAYYAALWLHSGDDDLAVGLPHTARDDSDLEGLIGFFVNTLVVRCQLSPELTFRSLVSQVRGATVGAYEHAALPFEALVTSRDERRDPSSTALVQATFMLAEDARADAREVEGLRVEFAPYAPPLARYDLSTWMWLRDGGMHGAVQYRSDLFDAARLEAFTASYAEVLAAAVADPDAVLGSLVAVPATPATPSDVAAISWKPGPIADATTELTADDVTELLDELAAAAAAGPAEVVVDLEAGWARAVAVAAVLDAGRWALLDGAPASIADPARIGADAAGRPVSTPWSGEAGDGGDGGGVVWADGTRVPSSLLAAMIAAAVGRHAHHAGPHAVVASTGTAGLVASMWPLTAGVASVHVSEAAGLAGIGAATAYLPATVAERVTGLDSELRSLDIEVDPDGAGLGDAWRSAVPGAEIHELLGTGVLTGVVARTDLGRPTAPAEVAGPEGAVGELVVGGLSTGLAASRLGADVRVLGRVATAGRRGGRRVHLGEVATAVAKYVGACRVELRGAEVVAHVDGALDLVALRATLLDNVAAPWVPDGFALTTAPATEAPTATGESANDLTARLLAIWAEVLERDDIGPDDDFFALGGHSLLAIRIASRVETMLDDEFDVTLVFEHPTVAGLAAALESAGHGDASPPETPQPATELEGPASFGQARFWVLDEVTPSSAHNCALVLELDQELGVEVLRAALADVVRRHPALRTRLEVRAGEVVQVVQPHAELPLEVATVASSEAKADLLDEYLARPVPLSQAPHGRALLVTGAPGALSGTAVLALCIHHAATDAWSMNLITRDLLAALDARRRGIELPARLTEEPPTTYLQHAARQRAEAGDEASAEGPDWKYWSERLTDVEPVNLPTDLTRPETRTTAGDHVPLEVPAGLTSRLRAFAAEERLSAFMVGLAAYAVLLSRCGGGRELVIGVPASGRNRRELEGEVGYYLNTLPIRVTWPEGAAFRDIVTLVRREVLGALAHAQLPFEALAARFAPNRELGVTPLVQTLFSLDEDAFAGSTSADGGVRRVSWANGGAKFDLSMLLAADGDVLRGSLEYRSDICSPARAEEIGAWWLSLLDHCLATPDRPVELLPTTTTAASDPTLPTVAAGVSVGGGGVVDVGGLGEVVGRVWEPVRAGLAGRLRGAGVGPAGAGSGECVVGVLMERGPGLVEAVHAVVGAGGVYLPLEPDFPDDHLGFLLADAGCTTLVTEPGLESRVRNLVEQRCPDAAVVVHAAGEVPGDAEPVSEPVVEPVSVDGEELAYVIHTSGSTGRPKGVGVSHRAVANRLWWMRDLVGITADDRVLLKTPFSFDVSVWELFLPAYVGAVQVVAGAGVHRDSAALVELVAAERVSVVHFVPSMLDAFLAEPALTAATEQERSARWGELRVVVCSGEALTPGLVARVAELLPWVEVVNLYGPTEAAVDVTWHRVRAGESPVPIGVAVPHTRIEVLDEGLQRVPVGVAGELCIAGVQVARGYVGRPGLTARSFVPDPYGTTGARMYRTGDRARITSVGTVEFLGRSDGQVKVRGVRVELGEVRAGLERDPWVRAAWVVHQSGGDGGSLTGYVVPDGVGQPRSPQVWRDHLAERLPAHMVPTRIVELDQLPVTVNGKLDTAALAELETTTGDGPTQGGPPQTPTEIAVATVWADLLDPGRPLTVTDNFFDLGGHSILALKVVARLRASGYALTLRQVFEHQRLGVLAARLEPGESPAANSAAAVAGAADEAPFELLSTADRDLLSALFPSEEDTQ
ncbi:non-ribosomal peptide synthetase [Nocardioides speluncae]|uniref:non-ribosomal peptide synthetase n=1 Tax=Nocardioides speluncae TaxID=2670337 RepID=UPI000D6939C0|nr:non-ribosomal peptide synthetase [Nocardioides speluncae]